MPATRKIIVLLFDLGGVLLNLRDPIATFGLQISEAELPYDWREFLERFDSWPDRLFDQTLSVLQAIPASYRCALL